MPYIESKREFERRQKCESVEMRDGWLYENGAFWNHQSKKGYEPPPEGSQQYYIQRLKYEQKVLDAVLQRAHQLREYMITQGNLASQYANLPKPPKENLTILIDLRNEIEMRRKTVAELRAKVDRDREPTDQELRYASEAAHQQEAREIAAKAQAIRF
jgi:hypothetical protein